MSDEVKEEDHIEHARTIARNMLLARLSPSFIASTTGLGLEEIARLATEAKENQ